MIGVTLILMLQATGAQPAIVQPNQLTQAKLDAMSDTCFAPRKWLKHLGGQRVRFQLSKKSEYQKVDCVLQKLKDSLLPMNFGFIGNEAADPKADHQ